MFLSREPGVVSFGAIGRELPKSGNIHSRRAPPLIGPRSDSAAAVTAVLPLILRHGSAEANESLVNLTDSRR